MQNQIELDIYPTWVNDQPHPLIVHQCSDCGVLLDGPMQGFYPTTASGLVAILAGSYISHDRCDSCREAVQALLR